MKKIPLAEPIVLYISNVDLKVLVATASSQGYTLNKMISEIVRLWVDEQIASRR